MLRIAITGTHSVGKTTLTQALSERFELPMIREVARDVIKRAGYCTTTAYIQNADLHTKQAIQEEIFLAQLREENTFKKNGFVADRSIFDPIAYSVVYGISGDPLHKMIGSAITHALGSYDLLVYIPPMFSPVCDGFRDTSEEIRIAVDECLTKYIEAFELVGGTVLIIESQTVEERIEEVVAATRGLQIIMACEEINNNCKKGEMNEQATIFDLARSD